MKNWVTATSQAGAPMTAPHMKMSYCTVMSKVMAMSDNSVMLPCVSRLIKSFKFNQGLQRKSSQCDYIGHVKMP